jgi:rod shape-determining protein MreD
MIFSSRRPVRSSPSPFDTPQFRYAIYGVVALLLVLVQLALSSVIAVANITPDFVLIVVLLIALFEGRLQGAIAGFVAGLFLDIASGGVLGSHALVKTIAGFLLGHFSASRHLSFSSGSIFYWFTS